jgi:hypothetical protein
MFALHPISAAAKDREGRATFAQHRENTNASRRRCPKFGRLVTAAIVPCKVTAGTNQIANVKTSPTSNPAIAGYKEEPLRPLPLSRTRRRQSRPRTGDLPAPQGQIRTARSEEVTARLGSSGNSRIEILIMTRGWARFMHEDWPTRGQAVDVVHPRSRIVHDLDDDAPDPDYPKIVSAADFNSFDVLPALDKVRPVTPWP